MARAIGEKKSGKQWLGNAEEKGAASTRTRTRTQFIVGDRARSRKRRERGSGAMSKLERANSNIGRKRELNKKKRGNYGGKGGNEDRPGAERFPLGLYERHLGRKTKVEIGI